jgi:hypothetical protein
MRPILAAAQSVGAQEIALAVVDAELGVDARELLLPGIHRDGKPGGERFRAVVVDELVEHDPSHRRTGRGVGEWQFRARTLLAAW